MAIVRGYQVSWFTLNLGHTLIISNELNQRVSPKMLNQYRKHAKGCSESVCDQKLLTTHDDGTITISKCLDRLRQVQTQRKAYQH